MSRDWMARPNLARPCDSQLTKIVRSPIWRTPRIDFTDLAKSGIARFSAMPFVLLWAVKAPPHDFQVFPARLAACKNGAGPARFHPPVSSILARCAVHTQA